jgi:enterochelin esterase-like enzyme
MTKCSDTEGSVVDQTAADDKYGSGSFFIYLPPCYAADVPQGYPVLYLLHGANADNTQWIDLGVPAVADRLIQSRQIPATIIVMPREVGYTQDPNTSEYGNWIIQALIPWVDTHYRTCPEQSCRAIGGLSRGGSWAFRIGLSDWKDFGAIGLDSAVPFSGDLASSPSRFIQIPASQKPRFYLDIGKDDASVKPALQVVETLTNLRITVEWHLSDGAHNRAYWRAHVEDYLRWYFK